MCLLMPAICFAVVPMTARIGGTVTIAGTLLTQAAGGNYAFVVTFSNGTSLIPAAEYSGLNVNNVYIIDVPLFDAESQTGGASSGDPLVAVHK